MNRLFLLLLFAFAGWHAGAQCDPDVNPTPGTNCVTAPLICKLNGYCSTLRNPPGGTQSFCGNYALHNPSWFRFVATSDTIDITIYVKKCNPSPQGFIGMQAAMYKGCPTNLGTQNALFCQGDEVIDKIDVYYDKAVIGDIYSIVLDGAGGSVCDFEVQVNSGLGFPDLDVDGAALEGPNQLCKGDKAIFNANPVAYSEKYYWTLNGLLNKITDTSEVQISIPANFAASSITLCLDKVSNVCDSLTGIAKCKEIELLDDLPSFDMTGPDSICPGLPYTIVLQKTPDPLSQIDWQLPEGSLLLGFNEDSTSVTLSFDETHDSKVCATYSNPCSSNQSCLKAYKLQKSEVTMEAVPPVICSGASAFLVFDMPPNQLYNAVIEDGTNEFKIQLIQDGDSLEVRPKKSTTYFLSQVVSLSNQACVEETFPKAEVKVPDPPISVELGNDTSLVYGQELTLKPTYNIQDSKLTNLFIVDQDSNLICKLFNCLPASLVPQSSNTFYVFAEDDLGCVATDSLFVSVDFGHKIFVPNAFTPGGNDENDILRVFGGNDVKVIKQFRIFNRWGSMVFARTRFLPDKFGWDGSFKGQEAPDGVYPYILEVEFEDGVTEWLKGDITLLRDQRK